MPINRWNDGKGTAVYASFKRNEILIHAEVSRNTENTTESEINQTQKNKGIRFHLHEYLE